MYSSGISYNLKNKGKLMLQAGITATVFFTAQPPGKFGPALYMHSIEINSLTATYKLSYRVSIMGSCQLMHAFDSKTPGGSFIMAALPLQIIKKTSNTALTLQPQVFCFSFGQNIKAAVGSVYINFRQKATPLSIYAMAAMPVMAAGPHSGMQWNAGINYIF
jgi:hypothetical protein